jgi:uncharacterized protein
MDLAAKQAAMEARLCSLGRVLVAYSGGIDSAYLAWSAHQALGESMLAVIADSPSLARSQMADALAFAHEQSIPVEVIATGELERAEYARNDASRCFFCKDELFTVMERFRTERHFDTIAYGINLDDRGDYRPGQKAAQQHGVSAPLLEAGLSKQNIRDLARAAGLRLWNKPASACLASRIEYGRPVTAEALHQVEQAEEALRSLGFRQFRVRHHGDIARIEIAPDEMARAFTLEMAAELTRRFKAVGFTYITLDLEGYRSGSMNAVLPAEVLTKHSVSATE